MRSRATSGEPSERSERADARDLTRAKGAPLSVEIEEHDPGEGVGTHYIEIVLVDESDAPVAGERWQITLPDGRVRRGVTDLNGVARIDRLRSAGTCKISFPALDEEAWEKIG